MKKAMVPLTHKENKPYEKQKVCFIRKKAFSTDDDKKKHLVLMIIKSEVIVIILENIEKLFIVFLT